MPVRSLSRLLRASPGLPAAVGATMLIWSMASTGTAVAETISAGDAHACAVRVSGSVACWGRGTLGELGNGAYESKSSPVAVSGLADASMVSAGARHTCAVRSTGQAVCWGSGGEGQLGGGSKTSSPTPTAVSGLSDAVTISAGARSTCAVRESGQVVCWGAGTEGQLGNGTKSDSATPVAVTGISNATSVTVGYDIACAVREPGTVACWGNGSAGALGNGSESDSSTPVTVSGITNARIASAGFAYVCAVRSTGRIACWGNGHYGQLGNGGTAGSSTPVAVTGITEATAISAGAQVCAITKSRGVFCWGPGPLGDHGTGGSATPVYVTGNATGIAAGDGHVCAAQESGAAVCWGQGADGRLGNGKLSYATASVNVTGISDAMSVSAGAYQSCAVQSMNFATKSAGPVLCWGGGLANGHGVDRPTAVIVSGVLSATKVAAGSFHTCALRSSGEVSCWGISDAGALGSSLGESPSPQPVAGITDAVDLDAGGWLSCAVRGGGQVLCWGLSYGATPVVISGVSDAKSVAVGGSHACALRVTGQVVCWGSGGAGQLGNGAFTDSTTPVAVSGITNATAISAGGAGTCARRSTGEIACWGSGFLGDGTGFRSPFTFPPAAPAGSATPVTVTEITDATTVSVTDGPDDWFACATRVTGQVLCWGGNSAGELGNGSLITSTSPVAVSGITDAASVGAGGGVVEYGGHACVSRTAGQVRCWGDGALGQLGDGFMPLGHGPQVAPQAVVSLADVKPDPVLSQPDTPDTTPPLITVTTPTEGQRVQQGAAIQADFTCDDPGGSGVETCDGPATLDTETAGPKTLTVTAQDIAGNQASKSVNYTVDAKPAAQTPAAADTPRAQVLQPPPPPTFKATDSQILAALSGVLAPTGKAARIGALLKSGYTFTFNAPAAGKLQITWYYLPKGAKLAAKPKPIALATGTTTATGTGPTRITIRLNAVGKRQLKKAKSLKITTKATFTPTGAQPVSTTKTTTLRR